MKVLTSTGEVLVVGGTLVHGCADSIDGIETHFRRSVPCHQLGVRTHEKKRETHTRLALGVHVALSRTVAAYTSRSQTFAGACLRPSSF
jgi:hypothetical protein